MNIDQIRACGQFLADNPATFGSMTPEQILAALTVRNIAVTVDAIMTPVDMLREAPDSSLGAVASAIEKMSGQREGSANLLAKWGLVGLESRGIDLGNARTRAQLDAMAAAQPAVLTDAEVSALKSLAERTVSIADQRGWSALYRPGGISYIQRALAGE